MSVNTSQLALGPGVLYSGDFGATEPADTTTALGEVPSAAAWDDLGGTMGGITLNIAQEYKELEVDQIIETPESRPTKRQASISTTLAEVTHENFMLAISSGTNTAGTGLHIFTPDNTNSGDSPPYKAIILDGKIGQGKRRRFIGRKMLSTDSVEETYSKDGQKGYKLNLIAHYVSASVPSYKILSED